MTRGIRIVPGGYVQVRIVYDGVYYTRNFGPASPQALEYAKLHLDEKRAELRKNKLMGIVGIAKALPSRKFKEVAEAYYDKWSSEKDAEGRPAHGSGATVHLFIRGSLAYFHDYYFDQIRPVDVLHWREMRLKSVLGTSVNREQAVLSSIFSHVERWVKTEEWPAMKLPLENPTRSVEKASNRVRQRVLSITELKALKETCYALKDKDMWEICGMALKSLLRKKDLFRLETGTGIELIQAKTARAIDLPVSVNRPLNYANFRRRWLALRKAARLEDCQFRDLRKTGANLLKMRNHSNKLISEFLGHSTTRTTEIYMIKDSDNLKPLAKDLEDILNGL